MRRAWLVPIGPSWRKERCTDRLAMTVAGAKAPMKQE